MERCRCASAVVHRKAEAALLVLSAFAGCATGSARPAAPPPAPPPQVQDDQSIPMIEQCFRERSKTASSTTCDAITRRTEAPTWVLSARQVLRTTAMHSTRAREGPHSGGRGC